MLRFLLLHILFIFFVLISYSQERYDSLQNINKQNVCLMVGQTLVYPQTKIIKANLFWKNKKGAIFHPVKRITYEQYSLNDYVLNKHFLVKKILNLDNNTLLEAIVIETNKKVYINCNSLFESKLPFMYVEGYIKKLSEQYIGRTLYISYDALNENVKRNVVKLAEIPYASFMCDEIVALNPNANGLEFFLKDGDKILRVVDYEEHKKSKLFIDIILQENEKRKEEAHRQLQVRLKKEEKLRISREEKFKRIKQIIPIEKEMTEIDVDIIDEEALKRLAQKFNKKRIADLVIHGIDLTILENKIKKYGFNTVYSLVFYRSFDWNTFEKQVKKYGIYNAQLISRGVVELGWTKEMVIEAIGHPYDVNTSIGIWGKHEQWIYKYDYFNNGSYEYYYFENGKLTAIQE